MNILRRTALENNKEYLNHGVEVLIEGKNRKGEWFGKTRINKNVKVVDSEIHNVDLVGKFVNIRITDVEDFGLKGKIINKKL